MPRPDVSAERTAQIIEAAIKAFVRLGLAEARMEDIADEAGLSKATLYLYFDSKDALIGAILDSFVGRELAMARKLLDEERSASAKLGALIDIVVADTQEFLPYVPLYFDFLGMALREESIREVVKKPFNEYLEIVVAILEEGQETGEFREVDTTAAALALGTLIDGTLLLWAYDPQLINVGVQMRASIELMLDGLKSKRSGQ